MQNHEIDEGKMRVELMWRLHDRSEGKMPINRAKTIFIKYLIIGENF